MFFKIKKTIVILILKFNRLLFLLRRSLSPVLLYFFKKIILLSAYKASNQYSLYVKREREIIIFIIFLLK
jgi:hypothetical protein